MSRLIDVCLSVVLPHSSLACVEIEEKTHIVVIMTIVPYLAYTTTHCYWTNFFDNFFLLLFLSAFQVWAPLMVHIVHWTNHIVRLALLIDRLASAVPSPSKRYVVNSIDSTVFFFDERKIKEWKGEKNKKNAHRMHMIYAHMPLVYDTHLKGHAVIYTTAHWRRNKNQVNRIAIAISVWIIQNLLVNSSLAFPMRHFWIYRNSAF